MTLYARVTHVLPLPHLPLRWRVALPTHHHAWLWLIFVKRPLGERWVKALTVSHSSRFSMDAFCPEHCGSGFSCLVSAMCFREALGDGIFHLYFEHAF